MSKATNFAIRAVVLSFLLVMPGFALSAGLPIEQCTSLCERLDSDFGTIMDEAGIAEYPNGCKYGFGRGSKGVHRSMLVLDAPQRAVEWYRKRLSGWHYFRDGSTHVLYAGPKVNVNDPEIQEFGWDYSERTRIEIVGAKQRYGMCEWTTMITININKRNGQ